MKKHFNPSTPFWQAVQAVANKETTAPSVSYDGHSVNYFSYQLAVHKFELSLYAKGLKPNRHWKVSALKKYYGISGKPAQLVEQITEIIEYAKTAIKA